MKNAFIAAAVLFVLSCGMQAAAVPAFFDDFENGVQGSIWTKWTGSNQEVLQTSTSHNITPSGSKSALAWQADPTGYSAWADFGSFSGDVRAEVWVFEDHSYSGDQPVTEMLCLIGDNGTSTPNFSTDYLQLGAVSFWPGGSANFGSRTLANGMADFGITRKAGWTNLVIQADSIANGAQVRFYIDGVLRGTGTRTATNLKWVRLGNNSKSYENFWYDDVRVTVPEPASLWALGSALAAFAGMRKRKS